MDPDFICSNLGMDAAIKWKVGNERKTPKGRPLIGKYEDTYCVFDLELSENMTLADFLKFSNSKLYNHREFLKSIRNSGGTLEYYIAWFFNSNCGEQFDFELLKQLVDLGIELGIEICEP
jgi:hypothetical protein